MRQRKARVYFLSDIDGRNSGLVAVSSVRQVMELVPTIERRSIHRGMAVGAEAERLALGTPGQLFVRPVLMPSSVWRPSRSRLPCYAAQA